MRHASCFHLAARLPETAAAGTTGRLFMSISRSSQVLPVAAACASLLSATASAEGYQFAAEYTVDLLNNASGGIATGFRYIDNLDVTLEIDFAEAWEFGDGTLFLYGLYNNGTTFSDELVGDLQVVSNIDTKEVWRVFELWYELSGERWSVRTGFYDLNSEFDVKNSGEIFLNSSHGIGPDFAQTGKNGPSIFPVSSLAVRAQVEFDSVTARVAILDGVPGDPDNPASNAIDLGGDDGILAVGEVEILTQNGRLWAGYWHYSADFERLDDSTVGDGNDGWYIGVEQQLKLCGRSVSAYVRYGEADESFNPIKSFIGFGVVMDAPLMNRPGDQLGLGIATARVGDPYKAALSDAGIGPKSHETAWELTYRAKINEKLALQPNIQFVQNPAASSTLEDAWVIGLRVQITY